MNFLGTDTVAAMICARDYYGAKKVGRNAYQSGRCISPHNSGGQAAGGSIPASEHSTITSWGVEGEVDAMRCGTGERRHAVKELSLNGVF